MLYGISLYLHNVRQHVNNIASHTHIHEHRFYGCVIVLLLLMPPASRTISLIIIIIYAVCSMLYGRTNNKRQLIVLDKSIGENA